MKINYQKQLWTIVILLFSFSDGFAQCLTEWSFNNVSAIPTTCGIPWSENGQTMQMIPTTAANSCSSGFGCAFSIAVNTGNQYNYLNILSGELRLDITNLANLYTLRFNVNGGSGNCQTVRYYNAGQVVLEETVNSNYYQTNPVVTAGLTFDQIGVAVNNSILYGFQLKEICNDGSPSGGTNIGWEEFQQGTFGGSGNSGPMLNSQGVDVYVSDESGAMLPPSAAQYFIEHTVPSVFGYEENFMFPMHPIKFDFSILANPVISVYFDVQLNNQDQILKINDEDAFIGQLETAPMNIAPGFTLTNLGGLGRTTGNRYLLEGPGISSLVLGGWELFLDNVSFVQGQLSVCSIDNFFPLNLDCNSDGTFNLSFFLDATDAPGNTFSYSIDGNNLGSEDFNSSNIYEIENLVASNDAFHTFEIDLGAGPDCTALLDIYVPNCLGQECLVFEGLAFYGENDGSIPGDTVAMLTSNGVVATVQNYYDQDSSNVYFQRLTVPADPMQLMNPENINLDLDLSGINGTVNSLNFDVQLGCCVYLGLNNEYIYLADFNSLPSNLPPDYNAYNNGSSWTIEGPAIEHFSFGGGNIFIGNFCYAIADPICDLSNPSVEILGCNANENFSIELDFDYSGNTDSFNVVGPGLNFGNFAYADLPLTLSEIPGDNSTIYYLYIEDLSTNCALDTEQFGPVDCLFQCEIWNLSLTEANCTNGNAEATIQFEYLNPSSDFWDYSINGEPQGQFPLATPQSISAIVDISSGITGQTNELLVCVTNQPDCCQWIQFEMPACTQCEITQVSVQTTDCNSQNEFFADLIVSGNNTSDSFALNLDGQFIGNFSYGELHDFGPFAGGITEIYNFDIVDLNNPDCNASIDFGEVSCPPSCDLANPVFTLSDCDPFARFSAEIDFDYGNLTGEFAVYQNGIYVGNYNYTDLPITRQGFEGDGMTENVVVIQHASNASCTLTIDIGIVNCTQQCALLEFIVFNQTCNPDGTANITFSMIAVNTSSTDFELTLNGENLGIFQENPDYQYTIENVTLIPNAENELNACIVDGSVCCETTVFDGIECLASCEIQDMVVEVNDCNSDGFFSVDLDFMYQNTNDSFELFGNGQNYGYFAYTDLPITIDGFEGDGTTLFNFVASNIGTNCDNDVLFGPISCPVNNCEISTPTVFFEFCDGEIPNGIIEFETVNPGNDFFEYWINGEYQGQVELNADNFYLVPLEGADPFIDNLLEVCIKDQPNCCTSTFFEVENCSACSIRDLTVDIGDCDFGEFSVELNFIHENASDSFNLVGNGQNYGNYSYADLPIIIGGFAGDGSTVYEFAATDLDNNSCTDDIGFGPVDCPTFTCEISNLTVTEQTCDGIPYGLISFETSNPGNDFWEYWINGEYQGIEALNTSNSYWVPLEGADPFIDNLLEVCINDQPDCCNSTFFEVPDCDECSISDITVEIGVCDFGEFSVELNFIHENASDSFNLVGNGQNYGNYSYADLPIIIGGFAGDGSTVYEFAATDLDNNSCTDDIGFGPVTCPIGDCIIEGLSITDQNCDGTELFANVFFEVTDPGNDLAEYWINGEYIGAFALNQTNNYLLSFPSANPSDNNVLQVCINDNPDCCMLLDFDALDCNNDCSIRDLEVNINDCNTAGVFSVDLSFIHEYTSDSFRLQGNGLNYGNFAYTDLPITIENFVGDGTTVFELVATDIENNDCQEFIEFGPVSCTNSNCEMSDLFLTNFECDGGILYANLFFEVDSPGNNFFDYWINGELIETLALNNSNNYSLNFATADPLALNTLQVCINDNPDCCSSTSFEAIDCNPAGCLIRNLEASGTDCFPDGTNGVNISFDYDYPGNESFEVYLDNELLGTYNYSQLPFTVLHIDANSNNGVIRVNPVDDLGCALVAMVGFIDCEETYCMDFNDLPTDLSYNSGNIDILPIDLFEQEDVLVSLDNCGSNDFFTAEIRNPDVCQTVAFGDNAFFLESAALHYDFSNLTVLPNTLNFEYCGEGTITLNDSTTVDFGNDQAGVIISINGFTIQSWVISSTPEHGYVTISGEVSDLLICGTETTLGPVCYELNSSPTGDQCYGFENLIDGGFYPIGSVDPLIYDNAGFTVTLEDGFYSNGFLGISSIPVAPPFNAAISNYAILRGGLNFDLSTVTEPIEFFSFDFSGEAFEIEVNGILVAFDGFDPLDSLVSVGNGVVIYYSRENSNNWEGSVSIFGNVQNLLIVGEEIKLDNFCYFVNIQNSEVWPGDINADNIADHCDILYLGIANGFDGPERSIQTDNWSGQIANDWGTAFEFQNTNYKHADANGDGIINEEDVAVLELNLGKVHGPQPVWNGTPGTEEDPPLFVDLNANGPLIAGEAFSVPIMLGTPDLPVEDIYGLAFSIVFNSQELDLSNTSLVINDSWLGSDLWKVEKIDQSNGRIDIGMTRTSLIDTTGFGSIGYFTGIIEDLVGKVIELGITDVKALSHDESVVLIFGRESEGAVTTNTQKDDLEDGLHIFPIPTGQWLHVRNYNQEAIQLVKIYNVLGQLMLFDENPIAINQYDLDLFISGVYFIEIEFNGHRVVRKIEVFD